MKINTQVPICKNAHWIGNNPAWDIILTNGEIHYNVIDEEIFDTLIKLYNKNKMSYYDLAFDKIVRKNHIELYNQYHTQEKE